MRYYRYSRLCVTCQNNHVLLQMQQTTCHMSKQSCATPDAADYVSHVQTIMRYYRCSRPRVTCPNNHVLLQMQQTMCHMSKQSCATPDAADHVSHVQTIMAAPICGQFGVGSAQILISESQQLHALCGATYCSI